MIDEGCRPRTPRERGGRAGLLIAGAVVPVLLFGGCGDDDSTDDTLSPLDPTAVVPATGVAPGGDVESSAATTLDPAHAGIGFVSVQVRLPAVGVEETISLDRASVRADALDPVSLDATCTALDGGDGVRVSVVDLRRLGAGARLVSAALRVDGEPTAGLHDVTLDVSGADQVTTQYAGTVELAEGGWSGTFDVADAAGSAASGSFVCAEQPVATTTTDAPEGGGEEVPGSEPPPPSG